MGINRLLELHDLAKKESRKRKAEETNKNDNPTVERQMSIN